MTLADRRVHGDTPRPGVNVEGQESMPRFTDYLKADRGAAPEFFFERSTQDLGNDSVPVEAFTSPAGHQRETEKLWTRTWQVACRENEVPNVGDQLAYDIVGQSVLVVRTAPDEIKAFHNSCRHRGTRLVESCANASEIQCTFHSWTWNLDGTLKRIPCRWDFPTVCDEEVPLVEVKLARWNGMVWVNLDPGAGPLEDFLPDDLRRQLERWPEHRGWKAGHIGKILPCNWKAALEAFIEVYHAFKVHPELMEYAADANAQYDLISDTEVLDAIEYFVFPNTVIWGGYAFPMHYRVRPNGHDHRSCLWEVMIIAPMPEGVPLPPGTPMRMTPTEEPWSSVPEMALLGPILDQDMVNLRKLQRGMESDACQQLRLSNYQERNIRNFHQHLAALLEG